MPEHGGAREGAGRKPLPPTEKKTKRWLLLRPPLWEWLEEQRDGTHRTTSQVVESILEKARKGGKAER